MARCHDLWGHGYWDGCCVCAAHAQLPRMWFHIVTGPVGYPPVIIGLHTPTLVGRILHRTESCNTHHHDRQPSNLPGSTPTYYPIILPLRRRGASALVLAYLPVGAYPLDWVVSTRGRIVVHVLAYPIVAGQSPTTPIGLPTTTHAYWVLPSTPILLGISLPPHWVEFLRWKLVGP